MKPPPRTRTKRTKDFEPEAGSERHKRTGKWTRAEQRKLLNLLKSLRGTVDGPGGDIDYDLLQTRLMSRSTAEISSMVESLKDKVISSASQQLQKWRLEEKKSRKPIDEWTHMASALAGTLQLVVSAAFNQMLTVSSTEPCTLRNCDLSPNPRPTTNSNPIGLSVPVGLMPCGLVRGKAPGTVPLPVLLRTPAPTMGPARRLPAPSQVIRVPNNIHLPQKQPAASFQSFTTLSQPHRSIQTPSPSVRSATGLSGPGCSSEPAASCSTSASLSSRSQTPPSSSSSSLSHAPPAAPPSSTRPSVALHTRSKTSDRMETSRDKLAVDFERIYTFLSDIQNSGEDFLLTPMESAIVLDLLMSLPEELPLLDCRNLRKHLIQVYQGLSAPADSKKARELMTQLKGAYGIQTGVHGAPCTSLLDSTRTTDSHSGDREFKEAASENHASSSQSEAADLELSCPLLNPFMVPIRLLKRTQNPE